MVQDSYLNHFKLPKKFFSTPGSSLTHAAQLENNLALDTIYLDYAASTPLDLRVYQEMEPWLFSYFGNSANTIHPMGEIAKHALELARLTIADTISQHPEEIIFTSSATESNCLMLRGLLEHPLQKRKKIVYCATEHSSIASSAQILADTIGNRLGFEFVKLPVDAQGQIDCISAKEIIDEKTLCVCIMDVNNETGVVQQNLFQIEQLVHSMGALLHVDAVQGFARNSNIALGVNYDTAVISGAKIYGPRGAAALIVKKRRPRILLSPQLIGGGHEFGLRASTPNIPAIVGFAAACRLQIQEQAHRLNYYAQLENAFIDEIKKHTDPIFYGHSSQKCKGIISLSIPNVNAMKLLENTPSVCVSVGSACKTLQATASHVLLSMGVELEQALSSFRVSFGLCNSETEVRSAAQLLAKNAQELKRSSATLL